MSKELRQMPDPEEHEDSSGDGEKNTAAVIDAPSTKDDLENQQVTGPQRAPHWCPVLTAEEDHSTSESVEFSPVAGPSGPDSVLKEELPERRERAMSVGPHSPPGVQAGAPSAEATEQRSAGDADPPEAAPQGTGSVPHAAHALYGALSPEWLYRARVFYLAAPTTAFPGEEGGGPLRRPLRAGDGLCPRHARAAARPASCAEEARETRSAIEAAAAKRTRRSCLKCKNYLKEKKILSLGSRVLPQLPCPQPSPDDANEESGNPSSDRVPVTPAAVALAVRAALAAHVASFAPAALAPDVDLGELDCLFTWVALAMLAALLRLRNQDLNDPTEADNSYKGEPGSDAQ